MNRHLYSEQSRVFLEQAVAELARGDLRQASEKAWGAAAQMVKAVAEVRGWSHGRHGLLFEAINRIVEETNDRDFQRLFGLAGVLHANFYEGHLGATTVGTYLEDVTRFVAKMEGLLAAT